MTFSVHNHSNSFNLRPAPFQDVHVWTKAIAILSAGSPGRKLKEIRQGSPAILSTDGGDRSR
jgi:hypothetical protein